MRTTTCGTVLMKQLGWSTREWRLLHLDTENLLREAMSVWDYYMMLLLLGRLLTRSTARIISGYSHHGWWLMPLIIYIYHTSVRIADVITVSFLLLAFTGTRRASPWWDLCHFCIWMVQREWERSDQQTADELYKVPLGILSFQTSNWTASIGLLCDFFQLLQRMHTFRDAHYCIWTHTLSEATHTVGF